MMIKLNEITKQLDWKPNRPYQGRESHVLVAELAKRGKRYLGTGTQPDSFLIDRYKMKSVEQIELPFKGGNERLWVGEPTTPEGAADLQRRIQERLPRVKIETLPPEIAKQYIEAIPEAEANTPRKLLAPPHKQDPWLYTVEELRRMCEENGLPTDGKKEDLIYRLFKLETPPWAPAAGLVWSPRYHAWLRGNR